MPATTGDTLRLSGVLHQPVHRGAGASPAVEPSVEPPAGVPSGVTAYRARLEGTDAFAGAEPVGAISEALLPEAPPEALRTGRRRRSNGRIAF